jgi:hypothetical protein
MTLFKKPMHGNGGAWQMQTARCFKTSQTQGFLGSENGGHD